MRDSSARWSLPLIAAGQAQKEVFHNEALTLLDLLVQASVVAAGGDTPPIGPAEGQAWIVGPTPGGAWSGHAGAIAGWTAGGWRFLVPREGAELWCEATQGTMRFRGGAWEAGQVRADRLVVNGAAVVGAQQPAVPDATGGTTIDVRARTALNGVLAALRAHGLIAS